LGIHWKASPNKFSLAATYLFHPRRHVNIYGHHGIDEHRWFCLLGGISDLSYMFFQILICWYLQCGAGEFHWAGFSLSSSASYLLSHSPPSIHILLLLLFFFFPFFNFSSKLAMWLCGQWRICSEALVPPWMIQI
jgi:hypothetical protein